MKSIVFPNKKYPMKIRLLLIVIASLLLCSCANKTHDDSYTAALANAATSSSQSLVRLKAIEQAANPPQSVAEPPDPATYGMAMPITIDWNGPIKPLVKKIATTTNYKLRVLGTAPAIPIIISISAKDVAIGDVLRDVGYQCGNRAQVVVFPSTHTIELRYAKT